MPEIRCILLFHGIDHKIWPSCWGKMYRIILHRKSHSKHIAQKRTAWNFPSSSILKKPGNLSNMHENKQDAACFWSLNLSKVCLITAKQPEKCDYHTINGKQNQRQHVCFRAYLLYYLFVWGYSMMTCSKEGGRLRLIRTNVVSTVFF